MTKSSLSGTVEPPEPRRHRSIPSPASSAAASGRPCRRDQAAHPKPSPSHAAVDARPGRVHCGPTRGRALGAPHPATVAMFAAGRLPACRRRIPGDRSGIRTTRTGDGADGLSFSAGALRPPTGGALGHVGKPRQQRLHRTGGLGERLGGVGYESLNLSNLVLQALAARHHLQLTLHPVASACQRFTNDHQCRDTARPNRDTREPRARSDGARPSAR